VDPASGLGQERIVHPHDQGRVGSQGRFDRLPGGGEQGVGLDAAVAVEAVVGGPVLLVAVLGGEQAGEGVAAQGDQLGQGMSGMAGGLWSGGEGTL